MKILDFSYGWAKRILLKNFIERILKRRFDP